MTVLNRNIITDADISRLARATTRAEVPKTLDVSPPGRASARAIVAARAPGGGGGGADEAAAAGDVSVPSADDYLTKLLKFVPLEVLGAYLFIAGIIDSNVTKPHDHAVWLGVVLIGILLITIPYDMRVLNVVRPTQVLVSMLGLAIYVFSVGGWFATTTWYKSWYAAIALPLFGLFVAIIRLGPLPPTSA